MNVFLSVFDIYTLAGLALKRTATEVVDTLRTVKVDGMNNGTDIC